MLTWLDISERTAQWLDVKYDKKLMNEEELAKRFEDATYHCEHHNYDLNFVGKFALSELPRDTGFKVVLTGEGADENFAGYSMYLPDFLREPDRAWKHNNLPDHDRERLQQENEASVMKYYDSVGADASSDSHTPATAQLNDITTPTSMSAFQPTTVFTQHTRAAHPQHAITTIANATPSHIKTQMQTSWHPLHSALYAWTKGHLTNNFLSCLGDRTEMAHSIEARTPFLDHHLTSYINSLPPSVKIRYKTRAEPGQEFTEKWILREAAKPFITRELYERKKFAYTAPTRWPLGGPIHVLFKRLLTEERVRGLGFVEWGVVKGMLGDAFERGDQKAMRGCYMVGEWVVLAERFEIPTAVVGKT